MREGLPRSLGMQRTIFQPRVDVGNQLDALGGELGEDVKEAETVAPDFVGGKKVLAKS